MHSKISHKELKKINARLPQLKKFLEADDTFLDNGPYKKICISVFDHWLSHEEAQDLIFIDNNLDELTNRRQKFKEFIEEVFKMTELYTWKRKRHFRIHIKKPSNLKDVLRLCDFKNLWSASGRRYGFILPEYSSFYIEEWDWTNIIWYIDREKINPLLEKAKNAGLYILE